MVGRTFLTKSNQAVLVNPNFEDSCCKCMYVIATHAIESVCRARDVARTAMIDSLCARAYAVVSFMFLV